MDFLSNLTKLNNFLHKVSIPVKYKKEIGSFLTKRYNSYSYGFSD